MPDSSETTLLNDISDGYLGYLALALLVFGTIQITTGNLLGVLPLLLGVVGLAVVSGYIQTEWLKNRLNRWIEPQEETSSKPSSEDALAVLRERYARGELTEAEFERRLEALLETETIGQAAGYSDKEPVTERNR